MMKCKLLVNSLVGHNIFFKNQIKRIIFVSVLRIYISQKYEKNSFSATII